MFNTNNSNRALNRRRFLQICATSTILPMFGSATAQPVPNLARWSGIALGAPAEILLQERDVEKADEVFETVEWEINRLENIFSLYRENSELARLNSNGSLENPSIDMVELLELARGLHQFTDGSFDPTVQTLWRNYVSNNSASKRSASEFKDKLNAIVEHQTGFEHVRVSPSFIEYAKPKMAMTLNGIAQGYITDQIVALFKSHGYSNVMVDIGELFAAGSRPILPNSDEPGWPITIRPDSSFPRNETKINVSNVAIASSARFGTTFDQEGKLSHILDPISGKNAESDLIAASVIANSATIADGLSTSAIVCSEAKLRNVLEKYKGTKAFVIRENSESLWLNT